MCLFPWSASLNPEGGKPTPDKEGEIKLPCGKCTECVKLRAFEWGIRAKHEISLHDESMFLTLTYDDDHIEETFAGIKKPFQDFMKRLRKQSKKKLSYMVSHEYGTKTLRPHHHAIIFGYNPDNQKLERYAPSGNPLFTSPNIEKLWDKGFHSIGEANEKTAYYIASYALKGKKHVHTDSTGEIHTLTDTFDCSKRPAIGLEYFIKNMKQLIDSKSILPRYYQKQLLNMSEGKYPNYLEKKYNQYFLKKICGQAESLIEKYEQQKQTCLKNRGTYDRLAKFTYSMAETQRGSEYRDSTDFKVDRDYRNYLKAEHSLYDHRR